jgi:hypothetical protein
LKAHLINAIASTNFLIKPTRGGFANEKLRIASKPKPQYKCRARETKNFDVVAKMQKKKLFYLPHVHKSKFVMNRVSFFLILSAKLYTREKMSPKISKAKEGFHLFFR